MQVVVTMENIKLQGLSLEHIAACANRIPNCLDVGPNSYVAFGCSNSLVLYCPTFGKNLPCVKTFNTHTAQINSVKWIRKIESKEETKTIFLISGSMDKTIICWQLAESDKHLTVLHILRGHTDTITNLYGIIVSTFNVKPWYLIASASADSTLKVWHSENNDFNMDCFQTLVFKNNFILGLTMHLLPFTAIPILACAGVDCLVRLYVYSSSKPTLNGFVHVLSLKGHEDWVQSVDFVTLGEDLLLSSGSQDTFIRLWQITKKNSLSHQQQRHTLTTKQHEFDTYDGSHYVVTIDAILAGHENWVYTALWSSFNGHVLLLSTSMDKTVIVWEYDSDLKLWKDIAHMGEVGGNTLGFYGAYFDNDCSHIIANSFSGALHAWEQVEKNEWKPAVALSGHSSEVTDLDWEPIHGRYLITTSSDQTTRLFSEWKTSKLKVKTWHEMCRPQIHGYDLKCIHMINSATFVSGADEKVLRIFNAPKNFYSNLNSLSCYNLIGKDFSDAPIGASVPALGLSNKSVFPVEKQMVGNEDINKHRSEQFLENLFTHINLSSPPPETHLLQNSLWPECRKLYGHVFELYCVACNHAGSLIASAAKSSQPKHAQIMIWKVNEWEPVATLSGHSLTVTQMEFSPNDLFLLSVSRDRTWVLHYIKQLNSGYECTVAAVSQPKVCHTRIIWSCSWGYDNTIFVTGSRDRKIMVWNLEENSLDNIRVVRKLSTNCGNSVTSVALGPLQCQQQYILVAGFESGQITIFTLKKSDFCLKEVSVLDNNLSHCMAVRRIKWKPQQKNKDDNNIYDLCFSSCSDDHQVKIFSLTFIVENKPY